MKKPENKFAHLLDHLSGTFPNDERTSRINEKGFALCGLFYLFTMAVRTVSVACSHRPYINGHLDPAVSAPAVFCIMVLIMLGIALKQRRTESPAEKKTFSMPHLSELPRAAAALLSGKTPEDERTVQAFERGFAVCALLGVAYYGFCWLFVIWSDYFDTTFFILCAAPLLIGYVKMRENILTPPRFACIPLNCRHLLLRLPVYLLMILPFLLASSFILQTDAFLDGLDGTRIYSDHLGLMFFQILGDAFPYWLRDPWHIPRETVMYCAVFYLITVAVQECRVLLYRRRMQKMDDEENDLS